MIEDTHLEESFPPTENEIIEHPAKRLRFDWILPVLLRPKKAFTVIATQNRAVWLTPLLVLSLVIILNVLVSGSAQGNLAPVSQQPPPDFEYYSPEMQDQFYQAMQATTDPVFVYIFPLLTRLGGLWLGWLVLGGGIHLLLTLLGGRGETGVTMNIAAWASLPIGLRELVRAVAVLISRQPIQNPGLSGFVPEAAGGWLLFAAAFLSAIDLYFIWQVVLLVIGARRAGELPLSKTLAGVLIVVVLVAGLRALVGFGSAQIGNLGASRPFFF